MNLKSVFVIASLFLSATISQAANVDICRDKLLDLVGLDSRETKIEKDLVLIGIVDEADVGDREELKKGGPCELTLSIYQVTPRGATVSVSDSHYVFNPFNHTLSASNDSRSCRNSDANSVYGKSTYTQDSGWRRTFKTEMSLKKNQDGTLTLAYRSAEGRFSKGTSVTCTGTLR